MPNPNISVDPLTLHIALATYPHGQGQTYKNEVVDFYRKFKENYDSNLKSESETEIIKDKENILYAPKVYHLFGSYDIAFVSIIDNYKFSQKLFIEDVNDISVQNIAEPHKGFNPNSFQIITGICPKINSGFDLAQYFNTHLTNDKFIGICNLKLNSGFLIGNGQHYFRKVALLIDKKIRELTNQPKIKGDNSACNGYILIQSFSWFECCLLIFDDDINKISEILTQIRSLKVKDLEDKEKVLKNSLYTKIYESQKEFEDSHIFSDTHSYFGVEYSFFESNDFSYSNQNVTTQIEWQVKPGHLEDLREELKLIELNDKKIFNTDESFFMTGKSDYYIPENEGTNLKNNHVLFKNLRRGDNKIKNFVRRIKTKVLFKGIKEPNDTPQSTKKNQLQKKIDELSVTPNQILEMRRKLKSLKVSRQIREKILKILFNYNNGIKDPILFSFFVDFCIFIENLIKRIDEDFRKFHENQQSSINALEEVYNKYIMVFEEGYSIRMLNCYQFEEINDFDLDFNSSIQQLLTTYNSFVYEVTEQFFDAFNQGQVVQLNNKNTVSNKISIDYNVYHLTYPEFVFSTLIKEIINCVWEASDEEENLIKQKKELNKILDTLEGLDDTTEIIKEWYENKIISSDYILSDTFRIVHTYNYNIQLFEYWFWSFNLQNSALYDQNGLLDEEHFKKELFRLVMAVSLFDDEYLNKMKCPLPELYIYWDRYYDVIKKITSHLLTNLHFRELLAAFITLFDDSFGKTIYENNASEKSLNYFNSPNLTRKEMEVFDNRLEKFWRSTYKNVYLIRLELIYSFSEEVKQRLKRGEGFFDDKVILKNKFMFANALMYAYLELIYDENHRKVHFLKRNWEDGNAFKNFINHSDHSNLYYIDQLGGIFFVSKQKLTDYFKMRNAIIQTLWHFSLLSKRDFVDGFIKKKQENKIITTP